MVKNAVYSRKLASSQSPIVWLRTFKLHTYSERWATSECTSPDERSTRFTLAPLYNLLMVACLTVKPTAQPHFHHYWFFKMASHPIAVKLAWRVRGISVLRIKINTTEFKTTVRFINSKYFKHWALFC